MPNASSYKSYCWSLGTTSFRTKNFNKTIEEQLALLDGFWKLPENQNCIWNGNNELQGRYYEYMQTKGFVEGDARNKPKDAREKTSGLADIGLIDDGRHLTEAGLALLNICLSNDFKTDNFFQIPKDSFLYLKQLIKTSYNIDDSDVRPFVKSDLLPVDCELSEIDSCLVIDEQSVIDGVNKEMGADVTTISEAQNILEDNRYKRLHHLIDTKFTDLDLITLLDCFEERNDTQIRSMVTDNADVPTIFEYVLGILWYKVSNRQGKILDYMKLSLDADLLPKTHASGGEADIVYDYTETPSYPKHTLLLEATLAESTNQRRMEMEPVSRHLGQHLINTNNSSSYCVFVTTDLNINVISDFRSRKYTPYYDTQDTTKFVNGMKIIPLQTTELKSIVSKNKKYDELYALFEKAYQSTSAPHEWYSDCILSEIGN